MPAPLLVRLVGASEGEWRIAPEHEALFDELVEMLRATDEWSYVEREVEFRLSLVDQRRAAQP